MFDMSILVFFNKYKDKLEKETSLGISDTTNNNTIL